MKKDLLTGIEKVALIISVMDSNQARKCFSMLTKDEIIKVQEAMKKINKIDKVRKKKIINDFANAVQNLLNLKHK